LEVIMTDIRVKIILSGGPIGLGIPDQSVSAAELDQTLKLRYRAGYEHFVHSGEYLAVDGGEAAVFRWTGRTKIAE
jgi:hypothetical protein